MAQCSYGSWRHGMRAGEAPGSKGAVWQGEGRGPDTQGWHRRPESGGEGSAGALPTHRDGLTQSLTQWQHNRLTQWTHTISPQQACTLDSSMDTHHLTITGLHTGQHDGCTQSHHNRLKHWTARWTHSIAPQQTHSMESHNRLALAGLLHPLGSAGEKRIACSPGSWPACSTSTQLFLGAAASLSRTGCAKWALMLLSKCALWCMCRAGQLARLHECYENQAHQVVKSVHSFLGQSQTQGHVCFTCKLLGTFLWLGMRLSACACACTCECFWEFLGWNGRALACSGYSCCWWCCCCCWWWWCIAIADSSTCASGKRALLPLLLKPLLQLRG